jgi:hypothetical protein
MDYFGDGYGESKKVIKASSSIGNFTRAGYHSGFAIFSWNQRAKSETSQGNFVPFLG